MSANGLEVTGLFSEREERVLFAGLSFALAPGDIVQVLGPNGAGKTSLLRAVAGLSSRCEGEIRWRGCAVAEDRLGYQQSMHYLGHGAGIKGVLSPLENLRWSRALRGAQPDDSAIMLALEKVGLSGFERLPCLSLSAGQQRRVSLARLFCSPAALWILDEPFTAIDQRGVGELEGWIRDFSVSGGMVLLTSHQALSADMPIRPLQLGGG